ncbi:DUF2771 family protein [Prauserella cavernicola]|uniref:DUF2771 family protein n=1 Tax=Prauserella cavernicola TaxID=2800127 RepID=A0A934QNN8_9PSEU|nr:DUF2771 family protein [Prauserella cavernicola]MBK1785392.1 DUF2771 family protein [Prauserella cavernicola]
MRRAVVAVLGAAAAVLAGCSGVPNPEITFYADGNTVVAEPLDQYCDALLRDCEQGGESATLAVRKGMPVQISVPEEVASTPWTLIVQYRTESGELRLQQPVTFTDGKRHAYTVEPESPSDQIMVVEIQQLGAAYAADPQGNPVVDENGQPQLVARGVWSLQNEAT